MVEEVDVDAVSVALRADGRDCFERLGSLAPGAAGHGAGIVDKEDGVEGLQEGVRVLIR